MTELYLIRHGETDWNAQARVQGVSDIELNEDGRNQADAMAEILVAGCWDVIYSSPLKRSTETAGIISKEIGVSKIYLENDLKEFNFGKAEGMDMRERKVLYPERDMIPDAERIGHFRMRIKKILSAISERHEHKKIIVVSHACLIMEALDIFSYGKICGRKIKLENLSISLLTFDSEWEIPWYNRSVKSIEEDLFCENERPNSKGGEYEKRFL